MSFVVFPVSYRSILCALRLSPSLSSVPAFAVSFFLCFHVFLRRLYYLFIVFFRVLSLRTALPFAFLLVLVPYFPVSSLSSSLRSSPVLATCLILLSVLISYCNSYPFRAIPTFSTSFFFFSAPPLPSPFCILLLFLPALCPSSPPSPRVDVLCSYLLFHLIFFWFSSI